MTISKLIETLQALQAQTSPHAETGIGGVRRTSYVLRVEVLDDAGRSFEDLEKVITDLKDQITDLEGQITKLEEENAELKAEIL